MQRKKVFFFDFRKLLDTAMPLRVPFSPRLTPAQQALMKIFLHWTKTGEKNVDRGTEKQGERQKTDGLRSCGVRLSS